MSSYIISLRHFQAVSLLLYQRYIFVLFFSEFLVFLFESHELFKVRCFAGGETLRERRVFCCFLLLLKK